MRYVIGCEYPANMSPDGGPLLLAPLRHGAEIVPPAADDKAVDASMRRDRWQFKGDVALPTVETAYRECVKFFDRWKDSNHGESCKVSLFAVGKIGANSPAVV